MSGAPSEGSLTRSPAPAGLFIGGWAARPRPDAGYAGALPTTRHSPGMPLLRRGSGALEWGAARRRTLRNDYVAAGGGEALTPLGVGGVSNSCASAVDKLWRSSKMRALVI